MKRQLKMEPRFQGSWRPQQWCRYINSTHGCLKDQACSFAHTLDELAVDSFAQADAAEIDAVEVDSAQADSVDAVEVDAAAVVADVDGAEVGAAQVDEAADINAFWSHKLSHACRALAEVIKDILVAGIDIDIRSSASRADSP